MDRELTINIKGNSYTIKFPTVGQFTDIEIRKQMLSKGNYGALITSMTNNAQRALDIIDIQSNMSVLVPTFIDDLNVKSFQDIDLIDFQEIKNVYVKEVAPWINSWEEALKTVDDSKTDEE